MFGFLDDIKYWPKRAAAYITGRGATMTAVAIASPLVGGNTAHLPIIGLATGIPVNIAISSMTHRHRENKILTNFREELAAYFNVAPEEVTHDHLRAFAFGNPELGIEPNEVLREVLERNDQNRMLKIGSNILAAAGSMLFSHFAATSLATGALAGVAAVIGAPATIIGSVFLVMFTTSHLLDALGTELFAGKEKTAYEKIEGLAKQRGNGHDINKHQVMGLIISANPDLQEMIANTYHNANFITLPEDIRESIIAQYDERFAITDSVAKINAGQMKVNELAFIAGEERSGVPDRESGGVRRYTAHPLGIGGKIGQARTRAHSLAKELKDAAIEHKNNSLLIDHVMQGYLGLSDPHVSLNNADMPAGAVRLSARDETLGDAGMRDRPDTSVSEYSAERLMAQDLSQTIH